MDILDFHTHFFPDEIAPHAIKTVTEISGGEITPLLDGTMQGLQNGMKANGITTSVTLPVATKPEQVSSINSSLPVLSEGIIPFGAINPFSETWESDIDFIVNQGICGVKLHPEYQGFHIDNSRFFPFYEKLAESNLIALFHTGYDPGPFSSDHATPMKVNKMIREVPELTVVAAHFGGLLMWDDVLTELAGENIWFDTAAIAGRISPALFKMIVSKHDSEKILFGSDTPWEDQRTSIDFIIDSNLTESLTEKILGINGRKLLHRNG